MKKKSEKQYRATVDLYFDANGKEPERLVKAGELVEPIDWLIEQGLIEEVSDASGSR